MNYKSFDDLSADIKKTLFKVHSGDYDLVVGIPRSGMIPAYLIGLYLNVHVTDVDGFIENRRLRKGATRKASNDLANAHDAARVLLVDDSVRSGNSLADTVKRVPDELKQRITTLVVYADRNTRADVDIILDVVPFPRVFEWNVFHRNLLNRACVGIDGVICISPADSESIDEKSYIDFLINAKPYILPSCEIHSLVTSRLEKYRSQTETWLAKHGIKYKHLVMLDLPTERENLNLRAHATHKASYFSQIPDSLLFIESSSRQAKKIAQLTGKPVYCVSANHMFSPGSQRARSFVVRYLPDWVRSTIRPIYRRLAGNGMANGQPSSRGVSSGREQKR